jgi:poly(A) polymerase
MIKNITEKFPTVLKRIGLIADRQSVELYVVGGYVRDLILNRSAKKDIDFSVVGDALSFAQRLKSECDAKHLVVYERFGTAMLEIDDFKLEFVTAREESYSEDSRKPVVKIANLQSDLSRRDFTINTLAVGLNQNNWGKLYDPFIGVLDLDKKILKTPLDPKMTFSDDPLRILRAIRFATVLNFSIEQTTKEAIKEMSHRLEIISKERISDELFKMIASEQPSFGFLLMDELNVLSFVMPEMIDMKGVEQRKDFHHKDVFFHTLKVLDNVAKVSDKLPLRLTALLHDVAKPRTKRFDEKIGWTFHGHDEIGARMVDRIGKRLRISKEVKEYIQKLIRLHLRPIFLATEEVTDSAIRRLVVQAGEDLNDLITLCRADITSGNPNRVRKHLENFDFVMKRVQEVREKDEFQKFQSPVRGDKIMEVCKLPPGPLVGKIKHAIEEAILDGEIPNDYNAALEYLLKVKDHILVESLSN